MVYLNFKWEEVNSLYPSQICPVNILINKFFLEEQEDVDNQS